ncbi:MAG: hypothetical protein WC156_06760 [Pedobacter sp.]
MESPINNVEQQFFNDLKKKLRTSANKLLSSLDPAEFGISIGYMKDRVLRDFTTADIRNRKLLNGIPLGNP